MVTETLGPSDQLLRLDPRTGRVSARGWDVTVERGPDAGKRLRLLPHVVVGSEADTGLCLTDPAVSRQHLELSPRADGVHLRDLGSKNGTFAGGIRVQEAILPPGLPVDLGRTRLRFDAVDQDLGVPQARRSFGPLVGDAPSSQRLFGALAAVAPTRSTVLLSGETGTGKELIARAIHDASPRALKPFVVVDCAALMPALLESELFGHVKGAFTGASQNRVGAFVAANEGTVFLDEIGELPMDLQPRLLRALESGTVKPVGGDAVTRLDVRIIAATHRKLDEEVALRRFREDLYFRLAVVSIHIPPLRDRLEDLLPLARHFASERGAQSFDFSPALLAGFQAHSWPGNLRELRNVVERQLAGVKDPLVGAFQDAESEDASEGPRSFKDVKEQVVETFTREYLRKLWEKHSGNVSAIAREAGIHRNHVAKLLAKHGLK